METLQAKADLYRRRAQELMDLAATLSAPRRHELISVALMWKRMAERAEQEAKAEAEDAPR